MARTREEIAESRRRLKKEYGELFQSISALLFEHDPISINYETNRDEYEPEVETILPRLKGCHSAEDVRRVVHEEFIRWFGAEDVGPENRYEQIAKQIWDIWQKSEAAKSG